MESAILPATAPAEIRIPFIPDEKKVEVTFSLSPASAPKRNKRRKTENIVAFSKKAMTLFFSLSKKPAEIPAKRNKKTFIIIKSCYLKKYLIKLIKVEFIFEESHLSNKLSVLIYVDRSKMDIFCSV
jgi:hypothetical protein